MKKATIYLDDEKYDVILKRIDRTVNCNDLFCFGPYGVLGGILYRYFEKEINDRLPYPVFVGANVGRPVISGMKKILYNKVKIVDDEGTEERTWVYLRNITLKGLCYTDDYHIINPPEKIEYHYPEFEARFIVVRWSVALLDVRFIPPY